MLVQEIVALDKRRCKVLTDGDFAFVLYRGEIKKYEIEEGRDLPEAVYREIVDTILMRRARERLLYLLKSSARTEQELRRKLEEGGYPKEAVDGAVAFGKEYRFIDDQAYVAGYVESASLRKSRRQMRYELQQKGIDRELLDQTLTEAQVDEETQIIYLLKKKGYDGRELPIKERQKLMAYLGRKGFSFDIIGKVMGQWDDREQDL